MSHALSCPLKHRLRVVDKRASEETYIHMGLKHIDVAECSPA